MSDQQTTICQKAFGRLLSVLLERAQDQELHDWLKKRADLLQEIILKTIKPWARQMQSLKHLPEAVETINSLAPEPGSRCIVFCVPRIYIQHINHSKGLRSLGHKTVLITNWPLTTYGPPLEQAKQAFDYVFCSDYNVLILFELLSRIQADLLYTVDYLKTNWFCLLATTLFNGPSLLEIYDLADNVGYPKEFSEKIVDNIFGQQLDLVENEARPLLYSRINGLIYKDGDLAKKRLFTKFTINCPALRFYPYFSSQTWQNRELPKLSKQDGHLHVVHTGFIPPIDPAAGRHLHHSLLDMAAEFARAQIHLHIYNPLDLELNLLTEFKELSKSNSFFHYHHPCFIWDLPRELSQYDLGWMVYNFSNRPQGCTERYQVAFCSRILTYIAAGLPVLVSKEFENMANLVKKYNIGQELAFAQLRELGRILSSLDIPQLTARCKALRTELSMESKIRELDTLINQITRREEQWG